MEDMVELETAFDKISFMFCMKLSESLKSIGFKAICRNSWEFVKEFDNGKLSVEVFLNLDTGVPVISYEYLSNNISIKDKKELHYKDNIVQKVQETLSNLLNNDAINNSIQTINTQLKDFHK